MNRSKILQHLLTRGLRADELSMSGTANPHQYQLTTRQDLIDYIELADPMDGCRTWFADLSLAELNRMDGRSKHPDYYPSARLGELVRIFFKNDGVIELSASAAQSYPTDQFTTQEIIWRMQTFYSLHRLQSQPKFTFPASALITPGGYCIVEPGTTRRIFAHARPDVVPVMLVDYRHPDQETVDRSRWTAINDYQLDQYEGIKVCSHPFTNHYAKLYQYENHTRYLRYLDDGLRAEDYKIRTEFKDDSAIAEKRGDVVLINGVPLCYYKTDRWMMIA